MVPHPGLSNCRTFVKDNEPRPRPGVLLVCVVEAASRETGPDSPASTIDANVGKEDHVDVDGRACPRAPDRRHLAGNRLRDRDPRS